MIIFIDESGTLPDKNDPVVVLAAVGANAPETLERVGQRVRKEIWSRKNPEIIPEIKFYRAGDRTRLRYLEELAKSDVDIFVLIADKRGQSIPDDPENYAALCYVLLEECLLFYQESLEEVVFDRHFHKQSDQDAFNAILSKLIKRPIPFSHVDSRENPAVNAADMIAGSLLYKYSGKDSKFYNSIKNRIMMETVIHWKEAKQRFINIKNST
ncbi:MAG: DUF3800 domain-containing protein [Patescibacteria group bacterium]